MGLIVIEGPDGSGKSTLAQRLRDECDRYMWFLRASTYPRDLLELQGAVDLLHYAKMMRFPTVTDRHPIISEMIYGPILRGWNRMVNITSEEAARNWLYSDIKLLIYCRPPGEVLRQNVSANPQLTGVNQKFVEITQAYHYLIEELSRKIPTITYDYTQTPISDILTRI